MADVIFVAVLIAFFALAALYVTWCDHIIGPDDFVPDDPNSTAGTNPATTDTLTQQTEVTV